MSDPIGVSFHGVSLLAGSTGREGMCRAQTSRPKAFSHFPRPGRMGSDLGVLRGRQGVIRRRAAGIVGKAGCFFKVTVCIWEKRVRNLEKRVCVDGIGSAIGKSGSAFLACGFASGKSGFAFCRCGFAFQKSGSAFLDCGSVSRRSGLLFGEAGLLSGKAGLLFWKAGLQAGKADALFQKAGCISGFPAPIEPCPVSLTGKRVRSSRDQARSVLSSQ
jgi:hypothetical protein